MNGDKFENESFNLEYKREISKSDKTWLKSIVSFSNTSGGELIVGIEDKTLTVVGIKEDRSTIEQRIIASDVDCEHILRQGLAKELIMEYAKEMEASYIVMGSHGRSGMYDVFVGSLTKSLTKDSNIPVVVIPIHENIK